MKRWAKKQAGFTIVELLIVVVVIAILAAITIVAYNGIQNRAKQSALQENAKQAATKLHLYSVTANETYPDPSAFLSTTGLSSDTTTTYTYIPSTDRKNYCVSATNAQNTSLSYAVTSRSGGAIPGQCVTNYVQNPNFEAAVVPWSYSSASSLTARSTDWAASGSYSLRVTPSTSSADTFASVGGQSNLINLTPGEVYTVTATSRLAAAQTGVSDGRARRVVVYSWTGATASSLPSSTAMANAVGSAGHSATFTVPLSATGIDVRLYSGATNSADNSIYWDNVMITKGSDAVQYGDGSSTGWFWDGTTNASMSIGPASLQ